MTDDRPGDAVWRRVPARLLIAVGALAAVGGAAVIIVTKAAADQALNAGSATAVLAVGVNSGYLFPAAGPNYSSAWIGLTAVILGIAALTTGFIAAYRRRNSS